MSRLFAARQRPLPALRRPPRMESHYPLVCHFVAENGYAIASQLQRRFPTYMKGERTVGHQLAEMRALDLIQVVPLAGGIAGYPEVFTIRPKGLRCIEAFWGEAWDATVTAESLKLTGRVAATMHHEVLLTELSLGVQVTAAGRNDVEFLYQQRRYHRDDEAIEFKSRAGEPMRLIPDMGFLVRLFNVPLLHFVELQASDFSRRRLHEKLAGYDALARSDDGQAYVRDLYARFGETKSRRNFRVLVVAHDRYAADGDRRRLLDLLAVALSLPLKARQRLWFTTVRALDIAGNDFNAAIWLRGFDTRYWHRDYQEHLAALPAGVDRFAAERAYIDQRIDEMPRHPLFPQFDG